MDWPPHHPGIGGLSEVLGWTEPQQEAGSKGFFGGSENLIKLFVVILLLDGIWFGYEVGGACCIGAASGSDVRWILAITSSPQDHRGWVVAMFDFGASAVQKTAGLAAGSS